MTRALALIGLALATAACARSRHVSDSPTSPTVCIENAAAAVGSITATTEGVRWHVLPGRTECKPVRFTSQEIVLQAESIGGGAAGPARYQTRIPFGPGCWHWRLTEQSGPGSLLRCPEETNDGNGVR